MSEGWPRTVWAVEDADRGPQLYTKQARSEDEIGFGWLFDEAQAQRAYLAAIRRHLAWLLHEEERTMARLGALSEGATDAAH